MKSVSVGARPEISQVLNEMKALKSRTEGFKPAKIADDLGINRLDGARSATQQTQKTDFSALLSDAVNQVNEIQQESSRLSTAFQQGDPNATLTEVVIASEKASVAFEAMTEVRNRLVNAYEDIMNMPI